MDNFRKIDLGTTPKTPVAAAASTQPIPPMRKQKKKKGFNFKLLAEVITVLAVIAVILVFILVIPAQRLIRSGKVVQADLKQLEAAVKTQNIDQASTILDKTKTDLADTQSKLNALGYLHFVPIAAWYYNDGQHGMKAASYGLDTAGIVIDALKPYEDVLGLKGKGTFTGGTASQRISTAVLTLGKITPKIGTIADELANVKSEVDAIDKNHYPSWLFGTKVNSYISQAQTLTDASVVAVNQARPLITALPDLLGENEPKKYLVLFQNDKELRATGGFLTAYAIFNIDKGAITVERSEDIYPLDDSIPNKPPAPAVVARYLQLTNPVFNLRDSNLSPDYVESMKTFMSMYNKASGHVDVDGVIAIDTAVLVSTIHDLDGQVTAGGLTFTDQKDPRCDCANAIYQLEDSISRPVNYIKTDRKGLLGSLLGAIMQKALQSSPRKYWGNLFQDVLITGTQQKHILFDLFDNQAQSGLEALNAAGRIQPFDGDYLHINDVNFGGDKANLYTSEAVEQNYSVASDGTITKTVTINYSNNHPPSDCSLKDGGLCLNSDLRDWLRVYVPKGSQLVSNTGSLVKIKSYDDLGKTVFEGYVVIRPMSKATYVLTYKLPFKLQDGSSLPLMVQKQPGTDAFAYTVIYNNRQVSSFLLDTDKKITVK